MARWARVVMGGGGTTQGVLTDMTRGEYPGGDEQGRPGLTAENRVRQFRTTMSPTAYRLAVFLAAALRGSWPLPLARVVQRVMLPDSRQIQAAEVLVGGLVRAADQETADQEAADGEEAEPAFTFLEGVEPILRRSLTGSHSLLLIGALDRYIQQETGQGSGVSALLLQETDSLTITEPFGNLGAAVIDLVKAFGLGGTETSRRTGCPPCYGREATVASRRSGQSR